MAEIHIQSTDASQWQLHYQQWRKQYGPLCSYINDLRHLIERAMQNQWLTVDQHQRLHALVNQLDHERQAVTDGR